MSLDNGVESVLPVAASDAGGGLPLSPDRPITTRGEDLLHRADFATAVAKALAGWKGEASVVVALYGEWGSGKSSVKNMVLEAVRTNHPRISIIEFNPWEWADRNRLAQAFFEAVAVALGRDPQEGERRVKKWREYAAYLGVASAVATQSRYVVGSLSAGAVVAIGTSVLSTGWLQTALVVTGVGLGLAGAVLAASHSIAASVVEVLTVRAKNRDRSLPEVKSEVAGMLAEMPAPLVVVVDDIDRLTPQEQQVVFQLVKANADFPKMVYLLSFDRARVADALSGLGLDGEAYLGKIVQVGFDLPLARSSDVHSILVKGLESLLGEGVLQTKFDQAYWGRMFTPGLAPYFRNLRHVRRFLNTLQLQVGLLSMDGVLDVNPIDLVAMEVLRVFEPSLYNVLPGLKDALAEDPARMVFDRDAQAAGLKKALDRALDGVPPERHAQALALVCGMFQSAAKAYRQSETHDTRVGLLAQSRVCHPEYFDRFFLLRVPQGELSDAAFDRVMRSTADRGAFVGELRELCRQGLSRALFDRLYASAGAFEVGHVRSVVTGVFDVGDAIPRERAPSFVASPAVRARLTVDAVLERLPKEQRLAAARPCLADTIGLHLPVLWVARELLRDGQQRSPDDYVLSAEEAEELRGPAVEMLRAAAVSHELDANAHLGMLLPAWRELGDEAEVRAYVSDMIGRADQNAAALLVAVSGTVSGRSGLRFTIQLSTLELYADPAVIDAALARLTPAAVEGDKGRAVVAYEKAKQRMEKGLPDDPFADDDD